MELVFKRGILSEILISLLVLSLIGNWSLVLVSQASNVRFSGVVYAASGIPVVNAIVSASGANGSGYAVTDSSGAYLINSGLGSGNYTVEAIATGYMISNATAQVTVGHTTSGTNLYLNLSGAITGKVTDAVSSAPLQGVDVYASSSSGGSFGWFAVTDSNGDYTIATNLATGTYNVTVLFPTGYVTGTVSGVSVTAGATTSGVNLALARSGTISGRITAYPSGAPLANASVEATYGSYFGSATSNATGYYNIVSGLGNGTYTVFADYSEHGSFGFNETTGVSVTAGQETSNVNMEITVTPPTPSGIITGKVTDMSNGNPIEGAFVDADGGLAGFGSAVTDASGNYVISDGMGTGTYNVTASATGYNSTTITGVSVTVNQTTSNVNFQLTPIPPAQSGSISGTVTGSPNAVPEFATPALLFLTMAAATVALVFVKKRTVKETQ
ncbi:MAG TPA: carboxypeptidase-like regulatory domain-containing protein [Candidatus Bathyarchaeia archaeon]|nr:carboxypeptidase-like regulatory domain-containing protein [Candidatus Bathyarchaeia archaeon]